MNLKRREALKSSFWRTWIAAFEFMKSSMIPTKFDFDEMLFGFCGALMLYTLVFVIIAS